MDHGGEEAQTRGRVEGLQSELVFWAVLLLLAAGCAGSTESTRDGGAAGTGGSSGASGSAGSGNSGGAGGAGGSLCDPSCNLPGLSCCSGHCTNRANDPKNCGTCGTQCGIGQYCYGTCMAPPCSTSCEAGTSCCGGACCKPGELCCDLEGATPLGAVCTQPSDAGTCPIGCPWCLCASPDTPIATPEGEVPIANVSVGDWVYSTEPGAVVLVRVLETNRTPVRHHRVIRLKLANGRVLEMSPLHPTADGRSFGDLRPGDRLDGIAVESVEIVPYAHAYTYDILPASSSGAYFAAGALVGSTLAAARSSD